MNFKLWLKGLGVAVGSSLLTAALACPLSPSTFNFSKAGLLHLAALAAPIALKAVLLYLKSSPLDGQPSGPGPAKILELPKPAA